MIINPLYHLASCILFYVQHSGLIWSKLATTISETQQKQQTLHLHIFKQLHFQVTLENLSGEMTSIISSKYAPRHKNGTSSSRSVLIYTYIVEIYCGDTGIVIDL